MGMTIDEVIKKYKNDAEWERIHNNTDYYVEYEQIAEWLEKYQKIERIVKAWNDMNSFDSMVQISKVVEGTYNNLCDSCTNIGKCMFQSGIVRTKCAFYMPPQLEPDNCGNYVVQEPTTKNDLGVDAVSRTAVLELIADYDLSMGQVVKGIHALPSVTPQEPKLFSIAEIKYDKDKLKELVNKAVLTVIPQEPYDKCEVTFKDDNAVSRLSVRDIIYANAYELEYPDGSSEYVVNRDELIKYLMELPPVYSKMFEPQESEEV